MVNTVLNRREIGSHFKTRLTNKC